MREALELHAGGRGARVGAVAHQVASPKLHGVEARRLGGEVGEALRHGRGDGVADGAVLAGRRLVLQHHRGLGAEVGEVIGTADKVDDLVALDGTRARIDGIGADAGQVVDVDGGDAAIRVDGHAPLDAVVARMDIAGEALEPVGDELDGPTHDPGDDGDRHLVRIDVHLDAVAAADIRADHAHVALRQAHVLGEHALHHVRGLGGVIDRELAGCPVVVGDYGARLHRQPRVPAGVKGGLDNLVGSSESLVDLAAFVDALKAQVVARARDG